MLAELCAIAQAAGEAILEVYGSEFSVQLKDDRSPLTEADRVSHRIIGERLRALDDALPMLSEESAPQDIVQRRAWTRYWLVDPLDGTKEFLKRNGEFTVNIALVDAGRAVLGVVLAPVLARLYYGAVGHGAWRTAAGVRRSRSTSARTRRRLCGSSAAAATATAELADYVAALGAHELKPMGSSLKICLIAEGAADIYPRLGPTSEWDTAAAQAILESAGGRMIDRLGRAASVQHQRRLAEPSLPGFWRQRRDWLAPIRSTRHATRGSENRH